MKDIKICVSLIYFRLSSFYSLYKNMRIINDLFVYNLSNLKIKARTYKKVHYFVVCKYSSDEEFCFDMKYISHDIPVTCVMVIAVKKCRLLKSSQSLSHNVILLAYAGSNCVSYMSYSCIRILQLQIRS